MQSIPKLKNSKIVASLKQLGLSTAESFDFHKQGARDDAHAQVWRCKQSGVYVVQTEQDRSHQYYNEKEGLNYWGKDERSKLIKGTFEDDSRRAAMLTDMVRGKSWCDVGTGLGGILDLLNGIAAQISAVEPQPACRRTLKELGISAVSSLSEIPDHSLDVCTLFHVFEHLDDPMAFFAEARLKLRNGGTLVIEVPHSRDALIEKYKNNAFQDFTFWTEHQLLHTKQSLTLMVEATGFRCTKMFGFQRYNLANHLYWLAAGKPGGHDVWREMTSTELNNAYAETLIKEDLTDTIIGVFSAITP